MNNFKNNLLKTLAMSTILLTAFNVTTVQASGIYKVTSTDQFYNDFRDHEHEMSEKVYGKQIEISATVQSIDLSLNNIGILKLSLRRESAKPLITYVKISQKETLLKLQSDSTVVLICDKVDKSTFSLVVKECAIKSFTSPVPEVPSHATEFTEGLKQGTLKGSLEIAKKMKADGLTLNDIIKYTGLTQAQITQL